jgi:hypothetical protein
MSPRPQQRATRQCIGRDRPRRQGKQEHGAHSGSVVLTEMSEYMSERDRSENDPLSSRSIEERKRTRERTARNYERRTDIDESLWQTAYDAGRRAAHEEVMNTFMSFGIDLDDNRSRREFFESLTYLRNARLRGRTLGMLIVGGIITVIVGALSTFLPSVFHK